VEDLTIEMLRTQAVIKEENEAKNILVKLKYKRRFGGNRASLATQVIADKLIASELNYVEPHQAMKPFTTTNGEGKVIDIKPVNLESLPIQFRSLKAKVVRGLIKPKKPELGKKIVERKASN
jgi:hypothetical protein